jgi:hypothetical protein
MGALALYSLNQLDEARDLLSLIERVDHFERALLKAVRRHFREPKWKPQALNDTTNVVLAVGGRHGAAWQMVTFSLRILPQLGWRARKDSNLRPQIRSLVLSVWPRGRQRTGEKQASSSI